MDGFLEKNLKLIEKYNPQLCKNVRNADISACNYEIGVNLAGEYNILIDGRPVHSVTGAQEEAAGFLDSSLKFSMNVVHVIYGLGLGYLLDTVCEHNEGVILLYEPNLTLLKYVFDLADFSQALAKSNVFVVSNPVEFTQIYNSVYRFQFKTKLYCLDFYKSFYPKEITSFEKFVNDMHAQNFYNHYYLCSHLYPNFDSMLKNFVEKIQLPLLDTIKDVYLGKTAVITSAGPSLYDNIEDLKKNRDKITIISVGTALRVLTENGITPDFVCYTEKYYAASQFESIDTSNMNFILEPSSAVELFSLPSKNKFLTLSFENNANHIFAELLGIELPYFEVKGTVAYQALSSAKLLGFENIILLGQDLAYTGGNCYSKGSVYEHLQCVKEGDKYKLAPKDKEKYKEAFFKLNDDMSEEEKERQLDEVLARLNSNICFTAGTNGEILPTSIDYKRFIGYFEMFAEKAESSKLYNASFGAQINGFENKRLSNILKDFDIKSNSSENLLRVVDSLYRINLKKVSENLRSNKRVLTETLDFIKEIFKIDCEKYTCDIIYEKFEIFNSIRSQNQFLRILTYQEYTYMAWLIREHIKSTRETTKLYVRNAIYKFFRELPKKIEIHVNEIDKIVGEINEICNTKS